MTRKSLAWGEKKDSGNEKKVQRFLEITHFPYVT